MTDNGLALAEREPAMLLELMGPASIIEKNPTPVATIMADGAATEAILTRLYGQPEGEDTEDRFTPYAITGDPAEIYGGIRVIDGDVDTANAFIRRLIGQVELPEGEETADAEKPSAVTQPETGTDAEQTSGLLTALKHSKLGRAAAIAAVSASMFFGHAAEAKGDTPPLNAPGNIPALVGGQALSGGFSRAEASAASSSERQECIQAGTAEATVIKWPAMYFAGIRPLPQRIQHRRPNTSQRISGELEYPAMTPPTLSVDCSPDYLRVISGKVFMEKTNVRGNPGDPLKNPGNWAGFTSLRGDAAGGAGDEEFSAPVGFIPNNPHLSYQFNSCVHGRFRKVDFVERNTVKDKHSSQNYGPFTLHKTVGEAQYVLRVPVHGNCKAAATSARKAEHFK